MITTASSNGWRTWLGGHSPASSGARAQLPAAARNIARAINVEGVAIGAPA